MALEEDNKMHISMTLGRLLITLQQENNFDTSDHDMIKPDILASICRISKAKTVSIQFQLWTM